MDLLLGIFLSSIYLDSPIEPERTTRMLFKIKNLMDLPPAVQALRAEAHAASRRGKHGPAIRLPRPLRSHVVVGDDPFARVAAADVVAGLHIERPVRRCLDRIRK